jgi:hypothetical protein
MHARTLFAVASCLSIGFGNLPFSTSHVAFAQGPDVKAAAQKKAREGQRLAGKGEYEKALALFKEAYEATQEPGYLYNIGVEQQALGHDVEAFTAFERFLRDVQKIPPEFVVDANQRQRDLRKRIGEVELRCSQEGARVSIDDAAIGRTPLVDPVRVAPGPHRIAFHKDGFDPFVAAIHVSPGAKLSIEAAMHAVTAAEPDKSAQRSAPAPIATVGPAGRSADRDEPAPSDRGEPTEHALHATASAGAAIWLSGARQTPSPAAALGLGAAYRVAGNGSGAELRLGVKGGLSFVSEPTNADALFSALANPMFVFHAVPNRFYVFAEVGVGVLVLSGLAKGSVLLDPAATDVSGALTALELRPGLGAGVAIGDGIDLYVAPSLAWSPSPSPLFATSSLVRMELAGGLMVGF